MACHLKLVKSYFCSHYLKTALSGWCLKKKQTNTQIKKFKFTLSPNFISITWSRDFCLCNRLTLWKFQSVFFLLLFKIISISVGETTKNCFYGSFAEVPWAALFSNWTSANFVLFFEGMAGCGQWCHWGRGKKRGVRERSWQGKAVNPSPSLLTQPRYCQLLREELFTARLAQFSEKDHSNSLRKS